MSSLTGSPGCSLMHRRPRKGRRVEAEADKGGVATSGAPGRSHRLLPARKVLRCRRYASISIRGLGKVVEDCVVQKSRRRGRLEQPDEAPPDVAIAVDMAPPRGERALASTLLHSSQAARGSDQRSGHTGDEGAAPEWERQPSGPRALRLPSNRLATPPAVMAEPAPTGRRG